MVTVLEKVLKELCAVRSKVWELAADLMRTAFGTPMFSQRPDAGYHNVSTTITWRQSNHIRSAKNAGSAEVIGEMYAELIGYLFGYHVASSNHVIIRPVAQGC
jgi:hypothetical protein